MRQRTGAFSMVELLVVIAIIGILAAVAIVAFTNSTTAATASVADANLKHLNSAVLKYNQAVSELTNATNSAITDEQAVFTNLQFRDGTARPGSPYLESTYKVVSSSATTTYRAVWNGRMYQLVGPGTNGTGLDLLKLQ